MRRIVLASLAALGLIACSANPAHIGTQSTTESPETTEAAPEPEPTPEPAAAPEPAPAPTPAPSTPVSNSAPMGSMPAPAASPTAAPCEQEIALTCAPGLVDGCLRTDLSGSPLTQVHVCIAVTPSMEYPPCTQEIAQVCAAGLRDACLLDPAPSDKHVCVKM